MKKIKQYLLPVCSFVLTLVSALFWVALRINYSGISKFLGGDHNQSFLIMNLPVMVCVLGWIGVGFAVAGLKYWNRRKWPSVVGLIIGLIMTVGALVVVKFGAKDYLRFIMGHFWKSLAVTACIAGFALVLYFPPKLKCWAKGVVILVVTAAAVVIGYQLRPCDFTYGAVVYAVEDDYQIVFSTSDSAIAWVEIGGECYYDLYAGSMRSADKVHKVEVPQQVLDGAGGYTICAKQMIYRGPFGGYTGKTISQSYGFRPVDSSDGLNHIALSDVHEAVDAATKAATGREDTDFVILLGDLVSMVETEEDAQLANELAHGVTKGEIPVIYVRGNHEIKGEYAEVLYKYVGSRNQDFYYTVTLGEDEVFAVVMDMGEDHEDDWWEYYGTARFDLYREKQTEMLEEILADGSHENYRYRMALCHIPVIYVDRHGYFEDFRLQWTSLLNDLNIDLYLGAHKHVLWPFIPGQVEPGATLTYAKAYSGAEDKEDGGYLTDFHFPGFIVGRRSLGQAGGTQKDGMTDYVCLATRVDFETGQQLSNYINSRHEIPSCVYPFTGEPFSDVLTQIKRPEKLSCVFDPNGLK